jgi:hypothetical protein
MEFFGPNDTIVPAPLVPTIQASWSQPRAWHGDTVEVRVQMGFVKIGNTLDLKIYIQGNPAPFHGPVLLPITGAEMEYSYKIDWSTKVIPANTQAFIVTARVVQYNLVSANSAPMLVDLADPLFSA